jgi:Carboxypeptidase regulatory-like domain
VANYPFTAAFSLLLFLLPVNSQEPLVGLIQGTVVDQRQAPIPYAGLTATNIDSVDPESQRRTTGADEKGFYQFVDVPEGRYSIVVKKNGYRNYKISLVRVRGGETVNLPAIKMLPATK